MKTRETKKRFKFVQALSTLIHVTASDIGVTKYSISHPLFLGRLPCFSYYPLMQGNKLYISWGEPKNPEITYLTYPQNIIFVLKIIWSKIYPLFRYNPNDSATLYLELYQKCLKWRPQHVERNNVYYAQITLKRQDCDVHCFLCGKSHVASGVSLENFTTKTVKITSCDPEVIFWAIHTVYYIIWIFRLL